MAAYSTYDYRSETVTDSVDGKTATCKWQVRNATSTSEALNAIPEPSTRQIAKINESHPEDSFLKCRSVSATRSAAFMFDVTAQYGIPPDGGDWNIGTPTETKNKPPLISWNTGVISLPTDTDASGYPYVNSAGTALLNPAPIRYLKVKTLTIVRWEDSYDWDQYSKFEDTMNFDEFTIGGQRVYKGEAHCTTIQPSDSYGPTAKTIPISYTFEILRLYRVLTANTTPLRVTEPWRIMQEYKDQGSEAWATIDGTKKQGVLCYATTGGKVETDKPLSGRGLPLDPNLVVKANLSDSGSTPTEPPQTYWPPSYLSGAEGKPRTIRFQPFVYANFGSLGILDLVK